ncbi:unnamed protein product [Mytilus coruscus]|uniref:Uncharacterized protein n=1 Tax=Mytilus coruscus TaxID=42192 RepID=A0A6J8EWX4_MYTCO|nr:unnamed protein product [Mytilus coruscus]
MFTFIERRLGGLEVIGLVSVPKPVLAIIGLNRTICPHSSQWSLRSRSLCNESKPEYLCLFDDNEKVFKEFCQKDSETQRPGYEFVIRGELDDKECIDDRYQPIKLTTDGNSQCMFQKSKCSGEGYQCIELKKFPGSKQCQEIKRPEMDGDVSNEEKGDVITSHLESKQCFLI